MSNNINQILSGIQSELTATKDNYNNFGKYKYRSCESILAALKPLLGDGVTLTLSDSIEAVGDRIYVKATATLTQVTESGAWESVDASAFAREQQEKKGMDHAQITGAASSYARKYALCGLFAIDDSQHDPDSKDNTQQQAAPVPQQQAAPQPQPQENLVEATKETLDAKVVNEEKPSFDADGEPQYEYDERMKVAINMIEENGLEAGSVETAVGFITKGRTVSIYNCDMIELNKFIAGLEKRIREELNGKVNPFESATATAKKAAKKKAASSKKKAASAGTTAASEQKKGAA